MLSSGAVQSSVFLFVFFVSFCFSFNAMLLTTYSDGTKTELDGPDAKAVYTVAELAARLKISERSAYDLIRKGNIAYGCAGNKNYRVGEPAVQHFLLGRRPLAA
jgi:excisionase family DNA binding protein